MTVVRGTRAPQVREIATGWLTERQADIDLGIAPEHDDRLRWWRVVLLARHNGREPVGELRIDDGGVVFSTDLVLVAHTTSAGDTMTADRRGRQRPVKASATPGTERRALYEGQPSAGNQDG